MAFCENLVFVDAETDGLYGPFISVAMKVIKIQSGEEIARFYYGLERDRLDIREEWVKENVMPYLGTYTECQSQEELLQKVWEFWEQYRGNSLAIADVVFPVEARLFSACVQLDEKNRRYHAPFPFLDLSTMLFQIGMDPHVERDTLVEGTPDGKKHNAMYDVDVSIMIWKKYMRKNDGFAVCEGSSQIM